MKPIRIANGQGFWGDSLEAPIEQVRRGPIDYLTLDYLAEITMSILQKQKQADPDLGYARDFPPLIARIAPRCRRSWRFWNCSRRREVTSIRRSCNRFSSFGRRSKR